MKRRVVIFSGNRSEYGLLYPVIRAISGNPAFEYRLYVSGAHLNPLYGGTSSEIEADGFDLSRAFNLPASVSGPGQTPLLIGEIVSQVTPALLEDSPDVAVVYGDRFEAFAFAIATTQMGIPTAHIEGGDVTEGGALDDSVRHAISKLSHMHFTSNAAASKLLLAMGEESWRINTCGLTSLDDIGNGSYASVSEVVSVLDLDLTRPIIVFTQHPVTTEYADIYRQISESLRAIEYLSGRGVQCIVTYPNNDHGSDIIIEAIQNIQGNQLNGIRIVPSLGRRLYHGVLALSLIKNIGIVCVGNSSSGIKETPYFSCPTVNIGGRQLGRLRGGNVIDVEYSAQEIINATLFCLHNAEFRAACRNSGNPYYFGGAGKKIADILSSIPIDKKLIQKKYYQ